MCWPYSEALRLRLRPKPNGAVSSVSCSAIRLDVVVTLHVGRNLMRVAALDHPTERVLAQPAGVAEGAQTGHRCQAERIDQGADRLGARRQYQQDQHQQLRHDGSVNTTTTTVVVEHNDQFGELKLNDLLWLNWTVDTCKIMFGAKTLLSGDLQFVCTCDVYCDKSANSNYWQIQQSAGLPKVVSRNRKTKIKINE